MILLITFLHTSSSFCAYFHCPPYQIRSLVNYKKYAPAAPSSATKPPSYRPTTIAAALVLCCAGALREDDAAAAVGVTLTDDAEDCAGVVVGSATPLGQCQWSPWGSQVDAVASCSSSSEWLWVALAVGAAVVCAGGVVGATTPEGQSLHGY